MKGKKVEILGYKISWTGCKWSNLNAPRSETPVSHSLLGDSLSPIFSPCSFLPSFLWGNKKLDLPVWKAKRWKFWGTKSAEQAANGPVWIPQGQKPLCLIHFWVIPIFPFPAPDASFLPLSGVIRNRARYGEWSRSYKDASNSTHYIY